MSDWLKAKLYVSDYRPVPLIEYLKIENEIFDTEMKKIRDLPTPPKKDPDNIAFLCEEIIPENSVLIFCSSKKGCETTATQLTGLLSIELKNHKKEEKLKLISELKSLHSIDEVLEKTIPFGIAYHHSGLTSEEREFIEDAYRNKIISVLCCTSTLAAGVNLPAKRVLFRTPFIGSEFLTKSRYKQMSGRAGRAGIDKHGESFLFLTKRNKEHEKGIKLVQNPLEDTKSQLNKTGVQKLILDLVCCGLIKDIEDVKEIQETTFCKSIDFSVYKNEFQFLIDEKFIKLKEKLKDSQTTESQQGEVEEVSGYEPTPFGEATFKSSFSMQESIFVSEELKKCQENGLVLSDELHLCYLVTPIGIQIEPNWNVLYSIYNSLPTSRVNITKRIELSEEFLFQMAMDRGRKSTKEEDKIEEMKSKRFYFALLLCDLVNEKPILDVEEKYKVNRGTIQQMMEASSMFSSMMVKFCERNGWSLLQSVLSQYSKRLSSGVKSDALELIEIDGVGSKRARALLNAGYKDIKSIAIADPKVIVEKLQKRLGPYPIQTSIKLVENAKKVLQRKSKLIKAQLEEIELLSNDKEEFN